MIKSKRDVIFLVGVLILSVSCETNSDNFENLNKVEFQFSDSKKIATRGTETDNMTIDNFGVYAYYTEGVYDEASVPNFMFNREVSRSTPTDAWTYTPVMYWPVVGGVTFFAYSPHAEVGDPNITLESTIATAGAPKIIYTVPDNVVDQLDLLISTPLYDQTSTSSSNANNRLSIPFKHSLSSIVFQAKMLESSPNIIKIKSIAIGKLKNKAKANYSTPEFSWDISADAVDTDHSLSIGLELLDRDISKDIAYTDISTTNGQLMLIPQLIDTTDEITVVVDMTIEGVVKTHTSTVKLSDLISTLEIGKRYTIKISVSGLANVDLTISINSWKTIVVDVPDFN